MMKNNFKRGLLLVAILILSTGAVGVINQYFGKAGEITFFRGDVAVNENVSVSGELTVNDYTLPLADGAVGQPIVTDGAGVASFSDITTAVISDFTTAWDALFATKTTDNLSEGITNLYDKIVAITGGTNVTIGGTYPNFSITDNSGSATDVGLNTTHRISTGVDHTYIDQSVVSGATPTFANTNFSESTDKNYVSDAEKVVIGNTSGENTGDQSSGDFTHNNLSGLNAGDYKHLADIEYTDLTDAGDSALHFHSTDRARANHTGSQTAATISDFDTEVSNSTDVASNTSHRTSDGSDHTFINQDVTTTGTPTFTSVSAEGDTNTDATDVAMFNNSDGVNMLHVANGGRIYGRYIDTQPFSQGLRLGQGAGLNAIGASSTFIGRDAGFLTTTGGSNTCVGFSACFSNVIGGELSGYGTNALLYNTGTKNSAYGRNSVKFNETGNLISAYGYSSARQNTTGTQFDCFGANCALSSTTGSFFSGFGGDTGFSNTTGNGWWAGGYSAGSNNVDGDYFTTTGMYSFRLTNAGLPIIGGSKSTFYGYNTRALNQISNNEIVIGADAEGHGDNTATIGNSSITDTYLKGDLHLPENATIAGTLTVDDTVNLTGDYNGISIKDISVPTGSRMLIKPEKGNTSMFVHLYPAGTEDTASLQLSNADSTINRGRVELSLEGTIAELVADVVGGGIAPTNLNIGLGLPDAIKIAAGNILGIGTPAVSDTRTTIRGLGNNSATYASKIQNSDGVDIATFRDDGVVKIGEDSHTDTAPLNVVSEVADSGMIRYYNALSGGSSFLLSRINGTPASPGNITASDYPLFDLVMGGKYLSNYTAGGFSITAETDGVWSSGSYPSRAIFSVGTTDATRQEFMRVDSNKNIHIATTLFKSPTIVATATYDILPTDNFVGLSHTPTAPVSVYLPALSDAWDATTGTGQVITIKDIGGNAGTNIITINRKTGEDDLIDGATFATIAVNRGSLTVMAISADEWAIY